MAALAESGSSRPQRMPTDENRRLRRIRAELEKISPALDLFGTLPFARFIHSLIRKQRPRTVVELGTGCGLCTFWIALALRENESGHLWTVDDYSLPTSLLDSRLVFASLAALRFVEFNCEQQNRIAADPGALVAALHARLELEREISLLRETIDLASDLPAAALQVNAPIDILFSDFRHDPDTVRVLLARALPRMAEDASVFIDSASTHPPTLDLMESLVADFNEQRLPEWFGPADAQLRDFIQHHRFKLTHLLRDIPGHQSSTSWLKIERRDPTPGARSGAI